MSLLNIDNADWTKPLPFRLLVSVEMNKLNDLLMLLPSPQPTLAVRSVFEVFCGSLFFFSVVFIKFMSSQ